MKHCNVLGLGNYSIIIAQGFQLGDEYMQMSVQAIEEDDRED